jgi:hypothetical protein
MVHVSKDHYHKGKYSKLNVKKIRPCLIKRRFRDNAYEVELSKELDISPMFNVKDLYDFSGYDSNEVEEYGKQNDESDWMEHVPMRE